MKMEKERLEKYCKILQNHYNNLRGMYLPQDGTILHSYQWTQIQAM